MPSPRIICHGNQLSSWPPKGGGCIGMVYKGGVEHPAAPGNS